jgi:sodium/proline symporter
MVLGMAGILFLALIKVGGFTGLHAKLAEVNPKLLSMWGTDPAYEGAWLVAIGAILLYAIGYMGLPHVVVRHMSMRNPQTAKGAIVWSALWNQFFIFAPYFLGLVAIILLPNLDDPEMVIPQLAHEVFPGFLAAIILSAIMAAVMSTADSQLIQAGSILSRDIYERFINPKATNRQMVIISRLLVFAIGIVGIIIAIYQPPTVFGLVIFAFGTLGSTFIVPYVAAVYSEKANKTGALAAMIAGAITCIIWTALNLEPVLKVHPFFAGLVASVIGMVIFNRFGTTPSQEVIEAVRKAKGIKGVRKPIEEGASLMLAPEAMAVAKHMKG